MSTNQMQDLTEKLKSAQKRASEIVGENVFLEIQTNGGTVQYVATVFGCTTTRRSRSARGGNLEIVAADLRDKMKVGANR